MPNYLTISTSIDLINIPLWEIVFVVADGNYSSITTQGGDTLLSALQLGQIEQMLEQGDGDTLFARIGKSLIVNISCIRYINIPKLKIVLHDRMAHTYQQQASREALKQLKKYMEAEYGK